MYRLFYITKSQIVEEGRTQDFHYHLALILGVLFYTSDFESAGNRIYAIS